MVVVSYCQDFLKADMQHIYRQVSSFRNFKSCIITQKLENQHIFPFPEKQISILPKAKTRFFRRTLYKKILKKPWYIYTNEVKNILYEIQIHNADVLHIYFGHIAIHLLPLIKASFIPVVVSFHGSDATNSEYLDAMQEVFKSADLILARSENLLSILEKKGCPREKLKLNRTGIFIDKQIMERELPFDNKNIKWRLVQACRLVEKKGLMTTLRAFSHIYKSNKNVSLHIIGDGVLKEEMLRFSKELGILDGALIFHGFVDQANLKQILLTCHIFIHPSETGTDKSKEGVPNSMLEAMSMSLPVVSTNHGGIPEIITDGEDGLLYEEKDWQGISEGVMKLMSDKLLYEKISKNGRNKAIESCDIENQILKLENQYKELLRKEDF